MDEHRGPRPKCSLGGSGASCSFLTAAHAAGDAVESSWSRPNALPGPQSVTSLIAQPLFAGEQQVGLFGVAS